VTLALDGPVLLATKLHPPLRRDLVSRNRLVQRLRPSARKLTIVRAPAGWGKTCLLADWAAGLDPDSRVAWVAVDPEDNDPVLFWSYVVAALRSCAPELSERPLVALRAGGRGLRETVLPSLINELLSVPGSIVLVLDDYHLLTSVEVHETLALLLERLPPQLHVLVTSRTEPPLPLGRLRVAGELHELRTEDLAFSDAEVEQLLNEVHGLELPTCDVLRLARRTEGWPAGLSLAATSLTGRGTGDPVAAFIDEFTGTDRYVLDYLGREVLARLPRELREFVLCTSVLTRLSPPLCEAITGRVDAAAALERVERAGVFLIPLDGRRHWYRYHRLFGELLRHELNLAQPGRVAELHRRAAAWFAEAGAVGDAVAHAVAAGEEIQAAELVATHWNEYFNRGQLTTVTAWLNELPPAVVRADARLCMARAWLLLDMGRFDEADPWLAAGDVAAPPGDLAVLSELAVLRCVHRFKIGDVGAADLAARRVLELGGHESGYALTVAHLLLGITCFWRGDLVAARRPLHNAVRLARRNGNPLGETYALGYLGLTAVHSGALDDAARIVPLGLERIADPAVAEHFVAALPQLAHAALLAAQGQLQPASAAALRGLDLARRGAGRLELALALALRAQTTGESLRDDPSPESPAPLDEARALIGRCRDPGRLPALLAQLRRQRPGRSITAREAISGVPALTERELQLLPLLAGTLSQREIGTALHLSLNTVKTHSRVLFRKLGVSNRVDAVSRARALGLLSSPVPGGAGR
jgi:LuxR family maltose regulon positive regulatory protein